MCNKKIAYISHVPWGTIKQRPQFLAEQLAKDFEVDFIELKGLRSILGINKHSKVTAFKKYNHLTRRKLWYINLAKIHNSFVFILAKSLNKAFFRFWGPLDDYQIVWFTHPEMFYIFGSKIIQGQKIIYDCMDDALAFTNKDSYKENLFHWEAALISKSEIVICSSQHLQDKICSRYAIKTKTVVINNAIDIPKNDQVQILPDGINKIINDLSEMKFPMVYIGAISDWFDFDLILKTLSVFDDVSLVLIGPCDTEIPNHERIVLFSPISRKYIFNIMLYAKILVMPFKVNELIKSVNPVKLYEYIFTGKPIVAPLYGETVKFGPFVKLYDSTSKFLDIIEGIRENTQMQESLNECRKYVEANTWKERYAQIKDIIDKFDDVGVIQNSIDTVAARQQD